MELSGVVVVGGAGNVGYFIGFASVVVVVVVDVVVVGVVATQMIDDDVFEEAYYAMVLSLAPLIKKRAQAPKIQAPIQCAKKAFGLRDCYARRRTDPVCAH